MDRWTSAPDLTTGKIFRAISRHGTPWGSGLSENVIWYVVRRCAEKMQLVHLAPHDLPNLCYTQAGIGTVRTWPPLPSKSTMAQCSCLKLCHASGGELEQIQFLLGHVSVLMTERYLGCKQNLEQPVNHRFGCLFASKDVDLR